jgi:TfoX/Sxy family transcriptional regulator of competence genes
MPHDPLFEQRIADVLQAEGITAEPKKMFGGVAFMINGNMSVGISNKGDFMARVDPTRHEELVCLPGVRSMDMTGKIIKGFLFIDPTHVEDHEALREWIHISLDYVKMLPQKEARASRSTRKK